jgi:hypothetical protein
MFILFYRRMSELLVEIIAIRQNILSYFSLPIPKEYQVNIQYSRERSFSVRSNQGSSLLIYEISLNEFLKVLIDLYDPRNWIPSDQLSPSSIKTETVSN